jgi:hypothetical protein
MAIIKLNTNVKEINVIGKLTGLSEGHAFKNLRVCRSNIKWEDGEKALLYYVINSDNVVLHTDVCNTFKEYYYKDDYEFFKEYVLNEVIYINDEDDHNEVLILNSI